MYFLLIPKQDRQQDLMPILLGAGPVLFRWFNAKET